MGGLESIVDLRMAKGEIDLLMGVRSIEDAFQSALFESTHLLKEAFDLLGIERLPGCQSGRSQPGRSKWTERWFLHRRHQCQPPRGVCGGRIVKSLVIRELCGTPSPFSRIQR